MVASEIQLQAYLDEIGRDVHVDLFNIRDVQLRLPSIKHKWAGRQIRHKRELAALKTERERSKKSHQQAIHTQAPVRVTAYAAERAIESSGLLRDIDDQIVELEHVIELLEKAEKILSSMTYDIGNMIKLIQLEQA